MADNSELEDAAKQLLQGNTKEIRTTVETLLKIFRNIVQNPEEEKYKSIKIGNSKFFKDIWRHNEPRRFLLKAGWKVNGPYVTFEDSSKLDNAIKALLSMRMLSPQHDEWTGEVVQGLSKEQLREMELREKAIKERDKEIAELFKGKEERKQIAAYVKAEHLADRERIKLLRPANVKGTE